MSWKRDRNNIYTQAAAAAKISYPETGNEFCFELENNSIWFKQRNELILTLMRAHPFTGDFLDIGGGNGYQAMAIKENRPADKVIVCEPGYKGCLNAKQRGVDFVYNGFFQHFPFEEYDIGGVGLFDVIEHIEDDEAFMNALYERIKPGTKVYINVPAAKFLWSETDIHAGHFRRFNHAEMERLLRKAPFKTLSKGYYFDFYVIPVLMTKVIPYRLGFRKGMARTYEAKKNIHKRAGALEFLISKFHKRSIKRLSKGKPPKFGTSMFAVLEK